RLHGCRRALARIVERSHLDCRNPLRRFLRFTRVIGTHRLRRMSAARAKCRPPTWTGLLGSQYSGHQSLIDPLASTVDPQQRSIYPPTSRRRRLQYPRHSRGELLIKVGKKLGEISMSDRTSWKMLHLLYALKPGISGLTAQQLTSAGVDCGPRTIQPLVDGKAVVVDSTGMYSLSEAARKILQCCVVANRRWSGKDMLV